MELEEVNKMLPSRKELSSYWFDHPIAGTFIALAAVEGVRTLWASTFNPKGQSPFNTYFGASNSTSTTSSTSHRGQDTEADPSTWEKHSAPGEKMPMFGKPKTKVGLLRGPPSMRRRISLNLTKGVNSAPQAIEDQETPLPTTEHFGLLGMMPEQSEDATDNPWV